MEIVAPETHPPVSLRDLSGPAGVQARVQTPGVTARLEKQQGDRFTIRLETGTGRFPAGTLVELITPERYYLGEISSCDGDLRTITTEHELDRAAVTAIQAAWVSPRGAATLPGTPTGQ